jgi:AcrR family transcriptional regulator
MVSTRRPGSETRAEILRVALDLFTRQGYEGTSIRDIAEALGVTKSSLYYHFDSKEAILRALVGDRRGEIDELIEWIDQQERTPDLAQRAALRWIDATTPQRILGMRFAHANRPVMARLAESGGDIRSWFDEVIAHLLPPGVSWVDRIRLRMAFDTVSAALFAALGTDANEADILSVARAATLALTDPRPPVPSASSSPVARLEE